MADVPHEPCRVGMVIIFIMPCSGISRGREWRVIHSLTYTVTIVQIPSVCHADGRASAHVSGDQAGDTQQMVRGFSRLRLADCSGSLTCAPYWKGRASALLMPATLGESWRSRALLYGARADFRFCTATIPFASRSGHYCFVLRRFIEI